MFHNMPIMVGQYRPLDSFLHQLDARAKIIPIFLVLVLALVSESFIFYMSILTLLIAALLSSGISSEALYKNFKPVFVLVGFTSAYHLIFSARDTEALISFFGLALTSGGVKMAFYYSIRLLIFISIAFLMTLTNSPSELGEAVIKVFKPLEKLRVPVNDLALILFMALRFIPILYDEFITIKNAQQMRGVNFSGSYLRRIKKMTSIIIPVFVAAIHRADDLALALEARGYRGDVGRTFYSQTRFGLKEIAFASLSTTLIIVLFIITY